MDWASQFYNSRSNSAHSRDLPSLELITNTINLRSNRINLRKVPGEKTHNFENSLDFAFGVGPALAELFTKIYLKQAFSAPVLRTFRAKQFLDMGKYPCV